MTLWPSNLHFLALGLILVLPALPSPIPCSKALKDSSLSHTGESYSVGR